MKKIAFIFPGQGSQYVGMGKDFYETFPCAKEMIDLAEKVSGIPMKELLFEENENINITKYTQIAMLADELAIWSVLREKGLESVVNAGLSLGEYAALVASGVMTPEDAFRVFAQRCRNREILTFSEVLAAGIPAGINLAQLIRYLSSAYRLKADVEQEIKKTLNAPKYNNRIIMAMPVCCIFLFRKIAPSYLEPLYYGSGRIVMVVVFLLLIVAWWTGTYLSNIRY